MIIAIAGKMGSGKDTGANHLVKNYGFKRMAFADNLKYMCINAFGLSYEQCFDEELKIQPFGYEETHFFFFKTFKPYSIVLTSKRLHSIIDWAETINGFEVTTEMRDSIYRLAGKEFSSPRHILQFVGTEICRNIIDEDYHAKVLHKNISSSGIKNVVISDCRFPNERNKIKEWAGFTSIVLGRETTKNTDSAAKSHASENSLGAPEEYDFVIYNDSTLEDFYEKIDVIMLNNFNISYSKELKDQVVS